jgi:hypothetical protein
MLMNEFWIEIVSVKVSGFHESVREKLSFYIVVMWGKTYSRRKRQKTAQPAPGSSST